MVKNLGKQNEILSNWSMYKQDIAKISFGAVWGGGALEAPNHALASPNEVVHDSECFHQFLMTKNLGNNTNVVQIGQYARYCENQFRGPGGGFGGSKSHPSTPKFGLTRF